MMTQDFRTPFDSKRTQECRTVGLDICASLMDYSYCRIAILLEGIILQLIPSIRLAK